MKTALLFAAFGALFCLRLAAVGLIDYDEAAYAQAAHEMLLRADWLAPSLNGEPFFEKPPLLYWSQILGYQGFGVGAFGARLGNALAALTTLAVLHGFSRRPLGERVAWLGTLVLGSSLAFVSLARVALTDIWLLLFLVLAIGCFQRAVEAANHARDGGSLWFAGGCASAGIAMLAKGAIGVLLPFAALLLYLASLRRLSLVLRPAWCLPGAAALLGFGLSWYLLLGATRADGFGFMTELFLEHHLARFASAKEGHRGPFLYYLPVLALMLAPWSAFLPVALARRFDAASERARWLRLLALLSGVTLVFFTAAATKLPHYALPALPGLALLIADRLGNDRAPLQGRALSASVVATLVLLLVLALGLASTQAIAAALPAWLGAHAHKAPELAYPLDLGPALPAAALALLACALAVAASRRAPYALARRLGVGMLVVWACLAWGVMPRWDDHFLRPLRDLASHATARDTSGERLLLVGLRRKPSTVFYGGRASEYASPQRPDDLHARLSGPPPRLALTSDARFASLSRHAHFEAIERDTGYVLFRAAGPPVAAQPPTRAAPR